MCHCSRKASLTDASVVLWQAVNCKGQHSISYTLSRNHTVVVEYSHDKDTDMFQVLFRKNKKCFEISFLFCPLLSINSVSACCLFLYSEVRFPRANQDLWYWTVLLAPPVMCSDTVLRMCFFWVWGGLCMRERVIWIEANEKKSKNRNHRDKTETVSIKRK